jgi:type IV secretory pathway VirB10-like protein
MNEEIPVKTLAVARAPRKVPSSVVAGALGLLGLFVFLIMASSRSATAQEDADLPSLSNASATNASPLPQAVAPVAMAQPLPVAAVGAVLAPASTLPSPFQPAVGPPPLASIRAPERSQSPILIVDFAQSGTSRPAPASGTPIGAPVVPNDRGPQLSNSENFSARVSREDVEMVEAVQLPRLNRLIPQGTMIAAAMETALNSDLPGFARAIVQRDVLSFEGGEVLIPAGSRVIGQYESGVAQGASRVFIVWTRLMRPDGVTIALASPAVDQLGRAGVKGKVNRHFLQRFGGSILLSVLSGGINAATAAATQGSSVVVSSPVQASGLAEQAAKDFDIPPTIKTPQGAAVRIFVARDLDFTRVGPMR